MLRGGELQPVVATTVSGVSSATTSTPQPPPFSTATIDLSVGSKACGEGKHLWRQCLLERGGQRQRRSLPRLPAVEAELVSSPEARAIAASIARQPATLRITYRLYHRPQLFPNGLEPFLMPPANVVAGGCPSSVYEVVHGRCRCGVQGGG